MSSPLMLGETLEQRIERLMEAHAANERRRLLADELARNRLWGALCSRVRQDVELEVLMYVDPPDLFRALEEEEPPASYRCEDSEWTLVIRAPGLCPLERTYECAGCTYRVRGAAWSVVVGPHSLYADTTDEALVLARLRYDDYVRYREIPL